MDVHKTISSEVGICQGQFQSILESRVLQRFQSEVKISQWKDELGRFRVWVLNTGAHQTCQLSLEYRLRDASHITSQVMRQLGRLRRLFVDLQDISEESSDIEMAESDLEVDPAEEVQLIYSDLLQIITRLYEMSILIRNPSSHDRLRQIKTSDYSEFLSNDQQHVYAKFPYADHDILNRLGVAISKRRALLKHRERHRQKLGYGVAGEDKRASALLETMATEYKDPGLYSWDTQSESEQSMTSYGIPTVEGDQEIAQLNPPEGAMAGQPFECELCYYTVQINDRKSWLRHMFSDLLPYVCTFPRCKTSDRLYEGRRQWVEHVKSHHQLSFDLPLDTDARCHLCQRLLTRGTAFDRHLARHLENLSLFAVPRSLFEAHSWSVPELEIEEEPSLSSLEGDHTEFEIVGGHYS